MIEESKTPTAAHPRRAEAASEVARLTKQNAGLRQENARLRLRVKELAGAVTPVMVSQVAIIADGTVRAITTQLAQLQHALDESFPELRRGGL